MHHKHARGSWPALHVLQLVLSLGVLQPTLLVISVVDFTRLWPHGDVPWPLNALVSFSSLLRRSRSESLSWDLTAALQNVFLLQMWSCARLKSWSRLTEGFDLGEEHAELKKRRMTTREQLEDIVMSSAALPLVWLAALLVVVLVGAPLNTGWGGTATLAAYLALLSLFPMAHIIGFPPSDAWQRILAGGVHARELLVLVPGAGAWVGAWLASSALALDWGRDWQEWPAPSVYGALSGVIIGNYIALAISLLRAPARTRS